jgi:hypothetical protein
MVAYKDYWRQDPLLNDADATNDYLATGQWRLERSPTAPAESEAEIIGISYGFFGHVPNQDMQLNSSVASHWALQGVNNFTIPGIIGLEADRLEPASPAPGRVTVLARTQIPAPLDVRQCVPEGGVDCPAHTTAYVHESGAEVFAAGTVTWSFGVDDFRGPIAPAWVAPVSASARTITGNVIERFQDPIETTRCEPELED